MLRHTLETFRDGLLSLTYPQACHLCSQSVDSWNDGVVCAACWQDPAITRLFNATETCQKCDAPLSAREREATVATPAGDTRPAASLAAQQLATTERASDEAATAQTDCQARYCRRCEALPFAFARACGAYGGALKANILFLKSQPHICRRLRDLLIQRFAAQQHFLVSDLVIPVPLHTARRVERGFNQAELLAQVIASHFRLRLEKKLLRRAKHTDRHRAGMDALDRLKSVERAFQVTRTGALEKVSVLLVDDLFTTGSTIAETTKTLLQAGAARVNVFTLAKVTDSFLPA
ncbi:MAG: ComF family protein [Acidobacteria bacterium]|nr:ComF family protein [Acidobacteriota bacterium]